MQQQPKICPQCNGLCKPFTTTHNPKSNEWYCEKCHKSYLMSGERHQKEIIERQVSEAVANVS